MYAGWLGTRADTAIACAATPCPHAFALSFRNSTLHHTHLARQALRPLAVVLHHLGCLQTRQWNGRTLPRPAGRQLQQHAVLRTQRKERQTHDERRCTPLTVWCGMAMLDGCQQQQLTLNAVHALGYPHIRGEQALLCLRFWRTHDLCLLLRVF